ncbi:glycoside hydrolase family 88 protein [Mariannaea sp. PMI_226]|nr:glycoside hydrolase family 88 protein [Mariannaea sp. PMI_226]
MGTSEVITATLLGQQSAFRVNESAPNRALGNIHDELQKLSHEFLDYRAAESIMKVATRPATVDGYFPHRTTGEKLSYVYEPPEWWTSGFFPGSIWRLYERSLKRNLSIPSQDILQAALEWQKKLESQQYNTTTHDLGFMIMPAFYSHYKLLGSATSREIVINAAKSLSSRWNETVGCLRSWDECYTKRFRFNDPDTDFLVIADNMMNLDLLYVGSELTGDSEFARRATLHATTSLKHLVRPDNSTYHLVNYNPQTGAVKGQYTVQGYADDSCWSRGQAWALYGYATAYRFTKNKLFLDASIRLSKYFCSRVNENLGDKDNEGAVFWDFDAPRPPALLDTSAAMIACSGMLLLYKLTGQAQFLPTVTKIMSHVIEKARAPSTADTILAHATVNNNRHAENPVRDTGLVYADYYFLEVGNRLIDMGF